MNAKKGEGLDFTYRFELTGQIFVLQTSQNNRTKRHTMKWLAVDREETKRGPPSNAYLINANSGQNKIQGPSHRCEAVSHNTAQSTKMPRTRHWCNRDGRRPLHQARVCTNRNRETFGQRVPHKPHLKRKLFLDVLFLLARLHEKWHWWQYKVEVQSSLIYTNRALRIPNWCSCPFLLFYFTSF